MQRRSMWTAACSLTGLGLVVGVFTVGLIDSEIRSTIAVWLIAAGPLLLLAVYGAASPEPRRKPTARQPDSRITVPNYVWVVGGMVLITIWAALVGAWALAAATGVIGEVVAAIGFARRGAPVRGGFARES